MAEQPRKDHPSDEASEAQELLRLPVVVLTDSVVFPYMTVPLRLEDKAAFLAVSAAIEGDHKVLLLTPDKEFNLNRPKQEHAGTVGTIAGVGQLIRLPDGKHQALFQGQERGLISKIWKKKHILAEVEPIEEVAESSLETEALVRSVINQIEAYVEKEPQVPRDAVAVARGMDDPGRLADLFGYAPELTLEERRMLLSIADPVERLQRVYRIMARQLQISEVKSRIQGEIQQGMEKAQREYYLREQLKAIHRELGETNPQLAEIEEIKKAIEESVMPDEVKDKARHEAGRLGNMPSASPEVGIVRTYLEWLLGLPWDEVSEEDIDISQVAATLDKDHYGLDKVKDRILEYLAVRSLAKHARTPILCLIGPPGVGKTSLGRSIARALDRKFVRISLGGVRDEGEIRGHRRTYIGALPGRIIQGMRQAGVSNPVFVLDEIDKLGYDFRGDPSSAMLEVLDPEQNFSFSDHYLEVPYDLSKVLFVATGNLMETIPPALLDRMEVINISGYTEEEKLHIARDYLVPRQLKQHGLTRTQCTVTDDGLRKVIRGYTAEAGVRNLERQIATIDRKVARIVAAGEQKSVRVGPRRLQSLLGPEKLNTKHDKREDEVGVVSGLAWTSAGGEISTVEAALMKGKGKLILTGQLGEVMQESAVTALSFARAKARNLNIAADVIEANDLHVHVPAGAVPKEGPSAGVALATSIVSIFTQRPVSKDVAMTGEVTLRGRVLPVGGLKEKLLAAHRAGVRSVVLPSKNKHSLEDVPQEALDELNIIWADSMDDVLNVALLESTIDGKSKSKRTVRKRRLPAPAPEGPPAITPISPTIAEEA
jgi:ATP-dependent Lon protease